MKNLFKIVSKTIELNSKDHINLWFWGDVHRDTKAFDSKIFNEFLNKSNKENSYYIGMGDYFDFASASEQKKIRNSDLHETTIDKFEELVLENCRSFVKELSQMRGKLLGLIGGNHTWKLENGKYVEEELADRLDCEYLGYLSLLNLKFKLIDRGKTLTMPIFLCHGLSGGKLLGTSLNKLDDMSKIIPNCIIYAMGHDHKRMAVPDVCLLSKNNSNGDYLIDVRRYFVRSGSFLKSYENNTSSYSTSKLMRPVDLGAVCIKIGFKRTLIDGDTLSFDLESIV